MARAYSAVWPDAAERLAAHFWPGPLTLVLPKVAAIPDRVTAGLQTVGLRVPRHPVALALLRAAGVPIAAPSANPFMRLSPTQAGHVEPSLADMILEGGPSELGIESTVLSLSGAPTLLRSGTIGAFEIEQILGAPIAILNAEASSTLGHAAPGLHPQHYSPKTPLTLSSAALPLGRGIWVYRTHARPDHPHSHAMPDDPAAFARELYATLHLLDRQGWDWIAMEPPPDAPAWDAIRDRLARAQHS